ncbi:MAG: sugar phosphate isomerase/epimerase family protein [Phycisphaerales bacterium]
MKIATSMNIRPQGVSEPQLMATLAGAGIDGIDLPFYEHRDTVNWADDKTLCEWADQRKQWAIDAGLEWVQAHGPFFDMFGQDDKARFQRQACRYAIKVCGRLGIPWMVLHPDIFPGDFGPDHVAALMKGNADFFTSLIPDCEKHHVGIAIENIFDHFAQTRGCQRYFAGIPDEQCALIDKLNHPLIGACWDTGHAHMNGIDQREGITKLGKRLKAIHIQESRSGVDRDDHVLPFSIEAPGVDWDGVCAGLKAINFPGPFTFETHSGLRRVPVELLDEALRYNLAVGRYLVGKITSP